MTPEQHEREERWAYEGAIDRCVTQIYVLMVWELPLVKRKQVYQTWRKELGDERARSLARFAEYIIEKGKFPTWFVKDPHAAKQYFEQRRRVGSEFEPWSEKTPAPVGDLFS